MSFTTDVKKEIIAKWRAQKDGLAQMRAGLSAFVRTSGELGVVQGKPSFFLVSETESVAEFFMRVFAQVFDAELFISHATMDRMSGRDKLLLQCPPELCKSVLDGLGLLKNSGDIREGISRSITQHDGAALAYIKGAFLGGGSCILPSETGSTGYHLEIVFSKRETARDFCALLAEEELIGRVIARKDTFVVYIKSKEQISDFLALVGAKTCLKRFSALVEKRDKSNDENRKQNCMAGNADKTAIAAVKQVLAIEKIAESPLYETLSEELKTLAKTRLAYPTLSLQELADNLHISKSCLNHRMRRLTALAQALSTKENE